MTIAIGERLFDPKVDLLYQLLQARGNVVASLFKQLDVLPLQQLAQEGAARVAKESRRHADKEADNRHEGAAEVAAAVAVALAIAAAASYMYAKRSGGSTAKAVEGSAS